MEINETLEEITKLFRVPNEKNNFREEFGNDLEEKENLFYI